MKLRPRLALTTLAVTVPMVLALVVADTLARRSAAEALLAEYALERLQDPGARAACEADPGRFGGPSRHGPPPGERRRPPPEGGGPRPRPAQLFAYDAALNPANPDAPAISPALAADLTHADVVHGALSWPVSEVVALVRMPWTDGPCAVVLAQGNTVPGFLGAVMPPTQIWLTPLLALFTAALIAFGPVLRRIRRLTAAVRASASAGYTGSVALAGHDELTELSRAFDDASREVRLQLAETDRREQALRRFLANTTHDVMIPLTVLQGHLSALQQHLAAATPIEPETVSRAMEEAHYIASLLHNLAIMARIDADEPQLQRGPVDLDALLARVLGRHRPIARQLDVALGSAPPAEPLTADADVTLLEQAVSNLVYNAIRHNRAGGHVAAILERVGDRFRFRVLDDGPGIPADVLARLTADDGPDDARTRSPDGHGLGLRIARRVAAIHHFALSFGPGEHGGLQVDLGGPCVTASAKP